jgi:hypothetical protein
LHPALRQGTEGGSTQGIYKDIFSGVETEVTHGMMMKLDDWGYLVPTKG